MRLIDVVKKGYEFSFEIIPPRNGGSINDVYKIIDAVWIYAPAFISVTHGAGGNLRGGTAAISRLLKEHYNIEPLAHLTCASFQEQSIENMLSDLKYLEIGNILALRGDAPEGEPDYKPGEQRHASELVRQISLMNKGYYLKRKNDLSGFELREGEKTNFCIAVAGYPEGHKYCKDLKKDIDYLKQKVDNGADFIITQMAFSPEIFYNYMQLCKKSGITIPIIPGIMPLKSLNQINYLEKRFSVTVPKRIKDEFEKYKDPLAQEMLGAMHTAQLMSELRYFSNGLHIYTMNNPKIVQETLKLYKNISSGCREF